MSVRSTPLRLAAFALLAVGLLATRPANAETIDQSNDDFVEGPSLNVVSGAAQGQSFRPMLAGIDFIDFMMNHMHDDPPPPSSYVVDLWFRPFVPPAGQGPPELIATSEPVEVGGPSRVVYRFPFASTIPTTVGANHFVLFRRVAGESSHGILVGQVSAGNGYDGGHLISPFDNFDLFYDAWFREGLLATSVTPSTWGRIKNSYR